MLGKGVAGRLVLGERWMLREGIVRTLARLTWLDVARRDRFDGWSARQRAYDDLSCEIGIAGCRRREVFLCELAVVCRCGKTSKRLRLVSWTESFLFSLDVRDRCQKSDGEMQVARDLRVRKGMESREKFEK